MTMRRRDGDGGGVEEGGDGDGSNAALLLRDGEAVGGKTRRSWWYFAAAFVLHACVGNAVFYVVNSLFLVLPTFIDRPVPEGKAIAADMSFTAQVGNVLLLLYLFSPRRPQPNIRIIMAVIVTTALTSALVMAFLWDQIINNTSITLWTMAAVSGSLGTFSNLFAWIWCSSRDIRFVPAMSSGMAASALIPSLFSIIMDPGPHQRYSLRVYYLIAAGFMALSAVSLAIIEVWDVGRGPRGDREYVAKAADDGGGLVLIAQAGDDSEKGDSSGSGNQSNRGRRRTGVEDVDHRGAGHGKASSGVDAASPLPVTVASGAGSVNSAHYGVNERLNREYNVILTDDDHADASTPLLLSPAHDASGASAHDSSTGEQAQPMVTGYNPGVSVKQAVRDTLHAHQRLIAFMAVLCWSGSLIFGWQPGLLPYLVPNGRPLVTYQVCGQVADVIGRGVAGFSFLKGKQLHAAAVQTISLAAMLVLAFTCNQHQHWFTPTMTAINSVFTFAYGVAATRMMMCAEDFARRRRPTPIGVERVLQLMGASSSVGSGIGGLCVYFVVKALF